MQDFVISRAKGITRDVLYVSAIRDGADISNPMTRVYQYSSGHWDEFDVNVATQWIARYRRPDGGKIAVYMSPDGYLFSPEPSFKREVIVNSISLPASKKLGRLSFLKQIDCFLVACGDGGQNYRQTDNGSWSPIDIGLFDDAVDPNWVFENRPSFSTFEEEDIYWAKHPEEKAEEDRRIQVALSQEMFVCIDGPSIDQLYMCGKSGKIRFHDGSSTQSLAVPSSFFLNSIAVENPQSIWICGRSGALVRGNAREGFMKLNIEGQANFNSVVCFQEKVYLTSYAHPSGLFIYDGRLRKVQGRPTSKLDDVHTVDAVDDVLWIVGLRSITRFDGSSFEPIPLPW